jgi:hypothetical protein
MANSIQRMSGLPIVSLGFVKVTTAGNAVAISANIDANNVNSPNNANPPPPQYPSSASEMTPRAHAFTLWGYKPGNNGLVPNANNIYFLMAPTGNNTGNKGDTGAILGVIGPGNNFTWPPSGYSASAMSPYFYYVDADSNNDGAVVCAHGCEGT